MAKKASRFIFPGEYDFRVQKPQRGKRGKKQKSTLLAYFNVRDTESGLEYRDMRLLEGENGVFVGSAFRSYENSKGDTKYSNYVQAAWDEDTNARDEKGVAWFEELAEAAYARYQDEVDEDDDEDEEDERPRRSAKKKSARGPVRPRADEDDEEDDEDEEDEKPKRRRPAVEDDDDDEDDEEDEEEEADYNTKTSGKKTLPF